MRLYAFAICVSAGVLIASYADVPVAYSLFGVLIAGALFSYSKLIRLDSQGLMLAALCIIGCSFGIFRMSLAALPAPDLLASYADKKVEIIGMVSDDPDEREAYTRLTVDVKKVSGGGETRAPMEKILVRVPIQSSFRYGDIVTLTGKLAQPENFETETGRVFDYVHYLTKDGIRYELRYADGRVLEHGRGNRFLSLLIAAKRGIQTAISAVLPDPEGALMNGILLGAKQSLGTNVLDDFKQVGLAHVVVLSGYNISLVAGIGQRMFSSLPRSVGLSAGGVLIVLFTVMAGATASAVRAALMALLALLGRALRRDFNALRALILVSLLMIVQNPFILAFDPSFQLSFLATLGLISVSPVIVSRATRISERFGLREIVVSTVATQAFVLPYLLYMVGSPGTELEFAL